MKANLQSKISNQQVKSFFNDGVVILRNVFDSEWISLLKMALPRISLNQVKAHVFGTETGREDLLSMIRIIGAELKSTENLYLKARSKKSRQDC